MTTLSRSSVDRLLTKHMSLPKSRLSRGKIYDRRSLGWRLEWSAYADPRVTYEPGNISVAYHPDADGTKRAACLDEAARLLTDAGYTLRRDTDEIVITGRAATRTEPAETTRSGAAS